MASFWEDVRNLIWGPWLVILILGAGVLISCRTGFVQVTCFGKALRLFFSSLGEKGAGDFQALCTALAATVGTGNLVGVAGAIALGGPGAVFWMWIGGFFGMATKYAEAALAVRCRVEEDGEYVGGPMYMIRQHLGKRWQFLGILYACFGIAAAFGVGNAAQVNALVSALDSVGSPSHWMVGAILALLVGTVVLGGVSRIGGTAEVLVPFASLSYLFLAVLVLVLRVEAIPGALASVFREAFRPRAAVGSLTGVISTGISRGVFTNEAGMGTASMAHAAAKVAHPAQQGLLGVMEVFLDTMVICTMTALVILCSGVPVPYGTDAGGSLTAEAFAEVCGPWTKIMLAGCICCFAFATVLGWGLYGARCARFLFGRKGECVFSWCQIAVTALGAVGDPGAIWFLSEAVNGLMAVPNLIIIAVLSPELGRLTIEYKISCGDPAAGGTYENFHQRQPLPALSHAKVPSLRTGGKASGQEDLPPEHRPARSAHPRSLL